MTPDPPCRLKTVLPNPENSIWYLKGVGGGKDLISPFFFIFTYVIELSFLVSKSAHLSHNSRWFIFYGHLKVGSRNISWCKKRGKNTGFWPELTIKWPLKPKGIFISWPNYLKICMKVAFRNKKEYSEWVDFWICFQGVKGAKTVKTAILALLWAINSLTLNQIWSWCQKMFSPKFKALK